MCLALKHPYPLCHSSSNGKVVQGLRGATRLPGGQDNTTRSGRQSVKNAFRNSNQETLFWDWRDGSLERSTCSFFRGHFSSQTYLGQFTISCSSSSRGVDNIFWSLKAYTHLFAHIEADTLTYTIKSF